MLQVSQATGKVPCIFLLHKFHNFPPPFNVVLLGSYVRIRLTGLAIFVFFGSLILFLACVRLHYLPLLYGVFRSVFFVNDLAQKFVIRTF